jgi:hypothetical protein
MQSQHCICSECGGEHERDANAAINLRRLGLGEAELTCGDMSVRQASWRGQEDEMTVAPITLSAKKPAVRPVWLLLGLAAGLLAAVTRKSYGRPFPRQAADACPTFDVRSSQRLIGSTVSAARPILRDGQETRTA